MDPAGLKHSSRLAHADGEVLDTDTIYEKLLNTQTFGKKTYAADFWPRHYLGFLTEHMWIWQHCSLSKFPGSHGT